MKLIIMTRTTFFLRSNKDKGGSHVLYCRVTYRKKTAEFSLGEKVNPLKWDQKRQVKKGRSTQTEYINSLIDAVSYKIKTASIYNNYSSPKELINSVIFSEKKQPRQLREICEMYIAANVSRLKDGTIRNHNVKLENLVEFEKHTAQSYTPESFEMKTARAFVEWFQARAATTNIDTATRNVLFYKNCLSWYQQKGELSCFPLEKYKGQKDPIKRPEPLTIKEVAKIRKAKFENRFLNNVRSLFLFQIATGLSYADIWSSWTIKETKAGKMIVGNRNKNDLPFFIPLTKEATDILDKYKYKLPKYENAVYNRVLKEIAALCGIDKRITTHTARKTFATIMDGEGWTRESVAAMLGHTSLKTTELYYLGKNGQRVESEMIRILSRSV